MSNTENSEFSERYPFEFWTEGALGRRAKCLVCEQSGPVTNFLKDPTTGEYREVMCPTCGVVLPMPGNIGRDLWNFMCEVNYEDTRTYFMETRYF